MKALAIYLILINALSFMLMLADKLRAQKNAWRIPEATLMTAAALGGSFGAWLGMKLCHHKTKKPTFSLGIPILLVLQVILLLFLYVYFVLA